MGNQLETPRTDKKTHLYESSSGLKIGMYQMIILI